MKRFLIIFFLVSVSFGLTNRLAKLPVLDKSTKTVILAKNKIYKKRKYFVQIEAYIREKPFDLIEKLKEKRYPFVIKKHDGIKLLLVGPFDTKKGAKKYLKELKKIQKDAFIKQWRAQEDSNL